jgi:ABC-type phosphate transport system auxiliary subunit
MGIFDELVTGLNREIGKVQNKTSEMIQSYTISSQIRVIERRKAALFVEIGHLIFDKYQRNIDISDEALRSKTIEISECEREITALQAELEAMEMESNPDVCTSRKSEAKAGYRPTPGAECPHCQAPADLDKSFCPSCGGKLEGNRSTGEGGNGSSCSSS